MARKPAAMVLAVAVLASTAASADSMTWKVRSYSQQIVELSFYSQNRKIEWPGNGKSYVIRDYDVKTYKLNCVADEKICYGAWVQGAPSRYWGRGKAGDQSCKSCCFTCKTGFVTPVMNLNEK